MDSDSKPKVYVTRKIFAAAMEILKEKCEVASWNEEYSVPREILLKEVETADALYCTLTDKIDEELLRRGKKLKIVATMSTGYDHINLAACKHRGILVSHTPGVDTEACAEFAMAVILCTTRRVIEANKQVIDGKWRDWMPVYMCGRGICGSVVGIVGMGCIGAAIAEKLIPFHPKELIYHNRRPNKKNNALGAIYTKTLKELLIRSDFIICCLSLSEETFHLFNKERFSVMKPTAQFFNFGRGALVDHEALYDALANDRLHAAGVDVCTPEPMPENHKLLTLPNFILTPHISSATFVTRLQMAKLAAKNIIAGLDGRMLPTPVPYEKSIGHLYSTSSG